MRARLQFLLHALRESFWFIPGLLTLLAMILSLGSGTLDRHVGNAVARLVPWVGGLNSSNAEAVLSTIAGSMITVASLVFSLTLVALTLASQQLGPRLLAMFMRDRMTQVVLGAFVGTFVYALLSLVAMGGGSSAHYVPTLSVTMAIVMTLASFGLLIGFVHHLAMSLQADVVVARVAWDLDVQVAALLARGGNNWDQPAETPPAARDAVVVLADASGYVQIIDAGGLVAAAAAADTSLVLLARPGSYLGAGEPVARIQSADPDGELTCKVNAAVVYGPKRTQAEDILYGVQAIGEIALRALSPGINDPYTAMTCLDHLGSAMASAMRGTLPDEIYRDDQGVPRVFGASLDCADLLEAAFGDIRRCARGQASVLRHLAQTLARLQPVALNDVTQTGVLRKHAELVRRCCERDLAEAEDQRWVLAPLQPLLVDTAGAPALGAGR